VSYRPKWTAKIL